MNVTIRGLRPGDIARVARDILPIEKLECEAHGQSPKSALRLGAQGSPIVGVADVAGKAEAIFGVSPVSTIEGIGRPWMLGTQRLRAERRAFLIVGPAVIAQIERYFPRLENYVHADNGGSIRWLARLGFVVERELVHVGGEPFRRFHKGF